MTLPASPDAATAPAAAPPTDGAREPRRNEILRHVIALIGEHGIDGMTMRQVARATGLSTGTVNYHFSNKRGLVLAALASAAGAPEGGALGGSPLARLRGLLAGFVLDTRERRAWWQFWVEVAAQSARDEELRRHERGSQTAQRRAIEELIEAGVRNGELPADLDAAAAAEPLLALATGLAILQLTAPDDLTAGRASEALEEAVRRLAAGAAGRDGGGRGAPIV
ncbi:MAG: TetR family transcriptional regulator [Dehalococcoidia bacterium]|nr:TetR family transcriptional regulator [Dehalococcoidia bacterium]